jgi:hypothetical protein
MRAPDDAVHSGNDHDGEASVIRRVLLGAAIGLGIAAGVAAPASADPSAFGTLGCSCKPPASAPDAKAPGSEQTNQGIRSGLDYLHGNPSR